VARRQLGALAVALTALVAAWVAGEPSFGGPDEVSHYQRAMSIPASGLEGKPVGPLDEPGYSPQQLAVVQQETREVRLPPGLAPGGRTCHVQSAASSAACLDQLPPPTPDAISQLTPVGSYPPATYVLPGLVGALADGPLDAAALGSAVSALCCLALLLAGVVLLYRPGVGGLWLAGPLVALSPSVLYFAAALNPSGPEIAAGVAMGGALLRLARPERPPPGAFAVAAVAACVLLLARSVSPAWVVAHVCAFGVVAGPGRAGELLRHHRRRLVWVAVAVGVAFGLAVGWSLGNGTDAPIGLTPLRTAVAEGLREARIAVFRHAVFAPGYLDTPVPGGIVGVWRLMAAALLLAAAMVATPRQRIALLVVGAAAFATPVLLQAALLRNTGFPVQGRHVLPVLVLVPLLAGELLGARSDRLPSALRAWFPVGLAVCAASAHVSAWWVVARRAAVSVRGPWMFLGRAEWDPPLGWGTWVLILAVGAVALVTATLPAAAPRASRVSDPANVRDPLETSG